MDGRIYGIGEKQIDGAHEPEYGNSPELTGMSHRAKQFVPFAALRGFREMVEEVALAHDDNIDERENNCEESP